MHNVPVWLLDVDGVVNAATKNPDRNIYPADQWVSGKASSGLHEWPVLWAKPVAAFIRAIHVSGRAEIRWHTTWQEDANSVGKLMGLPELPIADCPEYVGRDFADEWFKIGAARRVVEDEGRPLLWTDDDADSTWNLPRDVRRKIEQTQPTLIVAPSSYTGLCPKHLRKIDAFLTAMTKDEPADAHR